MFPSLSTLVALAALFASLAAVHAQGTTCNSTTPCPASAPCCSEYGFCGDRTFCLGGCNPLASNTLSSCKPAPVCENANHTFVDSSRILSNSTYYTGNASEYDWVVEQGTVIYTNSSGGEIGLLLTESGGGTLMTSTRYIHYGTITARMKTGRWGGVVTAFITMSGIKDEIDWEFPGSNTTQGQTNYFWQGAIPPKTAGEITHGISNTYRNFHDYTIDWKPDELNFLIDGKKVRTVKQSDTLNSSTGVLEYPSTPARIQLSIWPAGINSSAPGTIEWAGGLISWQDPDYVTSGHFYALVSSVSIQCADPQTPGPNITSYVYEANETTDTPIVAFSNQSTEISSALPIAISGFSLKVPNILAIMMTLVATFYLA